MTKLELFIREGAETFGNRLIYRNRDVGVLVSGELALNEEGEQIFDRLSDITDVEAKPVAEVVAPTKPAGGKKAAAPVAPTLDLGGVDPLV